MAAINVLLAGETFPTTTMVSLGSHLVVKSSQGNGAERFVSALAEGGIGVRQIAAERCSAEFPTGIEALAEYAVVVISDVDALSLLVTPQAQAGQIGVNRLELIKTYVANGGGLLMAGGYNGFQGMFGSARFHNTAVEDVLGVRCLPQNDGLEAPEGIYPSVHLSAHPVLEGLSDAWPPILGLNKLDLRQDGAASLIASASYRGCSWPLLTTRDFGKGRSIAWATDIGPHWLSQEFLAWAGYKPLMTNMIRWLARRI